MRYLPLTTAAVLGIVLGSAITGLVTAQSPDVRIGDWLQFAGAALGVIVTVLLALALEDQRQNASPRRSAGALRSSAQSLESAIANAITDTGAANSVPSRRSALLVGYLNVMRAEKKFRFALAQADIQDVDLWQSADDVKQSLDNLAGATSTHHGQIMAMGDHEPTVTAAAEHLTTSMLLVRARIADLVTEAAKHD